MESLYLASIFKHLTLKEVVSYCPCIATWTEQTLSTTSKGLKGNCTICSEQGMLCISFLPKADCDSASQFSTLLSLTLGSYFTASHSVHSLLPHAQPDTSDQLKVYGDESSLFSMSYPLLPHSYLDCSRVKPCFLHQKHDICIKLSLTKEINWHLSSLTSPGLQRKGTDN